MGKNKKYIKATAGALAIVLAMFSLCKPIKQYKAGGIVPQPTKEIEYEGAWIYPIDDARLRGLLETQKNKKRRAEHGKRRR